MDLTTWKKNRGSSGEIQLESPDGVAITIRDRVRPIASLQAIAGNGELMALRTLEGEHGHLVTIERDGTRVLAILEGDDFQTLIEGCAADLERARATVLELAMSYPLGLGRGRVRSVRHAPLPSWREAREGMTTIWTAPGGDAVIRVLPARPLDESEATLELAIALHDDRFERFVLERPLEHTPLVIGSLRGTLGRAIGRFGDGQLRVILTAGLSDVAYRYLARIDRDATANHDDAFFALVKSIVPIAPASRGAIAVNAVGHWAE